MYKLGDQYKFCPRCKKDVDVQFFEKNKNRRGGLGANCKVCASIKGRLVKGKRGAEKQRKTRYEWIKNNPEKARATRIKASVNMPDSYIAMRLTQGTPLRSCDVPPELIEAKRLQLIIHRETRKLKQALNQKGINK